MAVAHLSANKIERERKRNTPVETLTCHDLSNRYTVGTDRSWNTLVIYRLWLPREEAELSFAAVILVLLTVRISFLRKRSMTSENHDDDDGDDGKEQKEEEDSSCPGKMLEWLGMRPDRTIDSLPEEL